LAYLFTPITLFFRFLFITVASLVLVLSAGAGWFIMLTTFLCYCWAILLVGFGWLDWTSDPSLPRRVQPAGLLVLLGTLLFACGRFFVWIGVKKLSPVIGLDEASSSYLYVTDSGTGTPQASPEDTLSPAGLGSLHDTREFDGITRIGGARVVRDSTGQITHIGIARVVRDATGQITHIGGVGVARDVTGRITHIGGVHVLRDPTDRITHVLGMPVVRKHRGR